MKRYREPGREIPVARDVDVVVGGVPAGLATFRLPRIGRVERSEARV